MFVLGMAEEVAFKRIRAALAARRFPVVLEAVAGGRLHLSAVVWIAPHLTEENAAELVAECSGKSKAEIEVVLARRAPRPDVRLTMGVTASDAKRAVAESRGQGTTIEARLRAALGILRGIYARQKGWRCEERSVWSANAPWSSPGQDK